MQGNTQLRCRTRALCTACVAALLSVCAPVLCAQQTSDTAKPDAERGRVLFTDTYNCYACHGFDAQTGQRRLKPMKYTQEAFITFVRNSPLPQMPAFADAPAKDLADIYAYIRSIPVDAPPVDETPLLNDILKRKLDALSQ